MRSDATDHDPASLPVPAPPHLVENAPERGLPVSEVARRAVIDPERLEDIAGTSAFPAIVAARAPPRPPGGPLSR